jgi:hypothetical protein
VEAMARRLRDAMKDEALMIKCWTRFAGLTACASVQQFRRVFPTVDSLNAFIFWLLTLCFRPAVGRVLGFYKKVS